MTFPLVSLINKTINTNLNKRAITYYNGEEWYDETYSMLKEGIRKVQCLLKHQIFKSKIQYILLHLNITITYPAIVLGVLSADVGFLYVDPCNENEIIKTIEEFSIKYIISNIFFNQSHQKSFLYEATLEQSINICGETIGLWSSCNENNKGNEVPFFYAIKTSGSTGMPKTVHVPHDCIFPNLKDLSAMFDINDTDVMMLMTHVTFDPSIIELFLPLMNGATLCIIEKNIKNNSDLLLDILFPPSGGLVSIMQTTPSLFRRWNPLTIKQRLFSEKSILRTLILGGEEFPSAEELKSWEPPGNINIYNIYGITEVSCWASIKKVWPAKEIEIDIGRPLSETILQFNQENEDEAELLIGSKLRKCLINNEFAENIYSDDKVLFRATGDIFKNIDGKLYFKRRKDDIMKRWGIQFSSSSIEETTKLHKNVAACYCTAIQTNHHIRLGLFVIERNISDMKDLKMFLKKSLPKASWPDAIIALDSFPLTRHGKISLPSLKKILEKKKPVSKHTFIETWRHYSSERSSGSNDFFSDGGDSLTALQLVAELKTIFNDLPDTILGLIFQNKSCNEIWSYLQDKKENLNIPEQSISAMNSMDKTVQSRSINVSRVVLKGKIIFNSNVSGIAVIPNEFKFIETWKHNLGMCIDASPLGIELKSGESICIIGSHSGKVAVIQIDTGEIISECILPNRVESSACISVNAELYYIGCYDSCVYCVFTKSGKIAWKFQTENMVKSGCTIIEDCIIFGSYDRNIYCLHENGVLKWKTSVRSPVLGESVLSNNSVYCVTLGSIAALNVKTGQLLWEMKHDPIFSTPVFNNLLIVADVTGHVKWLNPENGMEEFIFKANDVVFSSLVLRLINEKEIIIFGCQDGSVYCLKERQLHWKTVLDARIVSTPFVEFCKATPIGFVICSSTKGTIFVLSLNTGEKISQYSLPNEVFSSPILINGKIIVGCRDDNVYCLDIK